MASIQTKIWKIQEDEIEKLLSGSKDVKIKIPSKDELFSGFQYKIIYVSLYTKFFTDMMKKEGQLSLTEISKETFSIARLNKWIGENIARFAKDIDDFTKEDIIQVIKNGNQEGLGVSQIVANVHGKFNEYRKKSGRIEKIVRTEITRASNKSQEEAYVQSGVVAEKEWFAALDERLCKFCNDLHKKRIKLGESFLKV